MNNPAYIPLVHANVQLGVLDSRPSLSNALTPVLVHVQNIHIDLTDIHEHLQIGHRLGKPIFSVF